MKAIFTFLLLVFTIASFGQNKLTDKAKPIVAEGKLLYRSEMASWYGTDWFLENYKQPENIGGYFSYPDKEITKCIFFSKTDIPKVIGTISFDHTYNIETAKTDLKERDFTTTENDLYEIRKLAFAEIQTDTLFKVYNNAGLNLIPLITGKEKKVYVLTGPKKDGVVIFGNDYLITFNNENKLVAKKQLHRNIITVEYAKAGEGEEATETIHTHLPETGDYITATDICTLMLYEKFAGWSKHSVVSKNYFNVWNCKTDELFVIPMDVIEKINKDQGQRNEARGKTE